MTIDRGADEDSQDGWDDNNDEFYEPSRVLLPCVTCNEARLYSCNEEQEAKIYFNTSLGKHMKAVMVSNKSLLEVN